MSKHGAYRAGVVLGGWGLWFSLLASAAMAAPSFISLNSQLPNPDQPYVMTSEPVHYGSSSIFAVYSLEFDASDPSQLAIPSGTGGEVTFDSLFDITYRIDFSIGLGPVQRISGPGTAHMRGVSPPGVGIPANYEFATELVSLDISWVMPLFETYLIRESPTMASTGIIRVEGACYDVVCPPIALPIGISSFFDVFTEFTILSPTIGGDGIWLPATASIHLEQAPEPSSGVLAAVVMLGGLVWRWAWFGNAQRAIVG